tara:strand:- start:180 stop:683 length:504 start_codon:yes stop_codon:yes gene_type:complete
MDKFLNIPEQDLVSSGTTTAGTANKLTDSSATFETDGVAIGDIVHNSTDNTYTTVTAIDSETVLTVGTTVPTAKAYFIHSATSSKSQLVSCVGIGLIEQASTSTVTITYDDAAASDVVTITHVPVGAGSEAMRDAIQNDAISALQTAWTSVSNSVELPNKVIGVSIG